MNDQSSSHALARWAIRKTLDGTTIGERQPCFAARSRLATADRVTIDECVAGMLHPGEQTFGERTNIKILKNGWVIGYIEIQLREV